jgi:hypothetical protein
MYEEESGLTYFRNRYFSSILNVFVSRDPLGYVDGHNLYTGYFAPNRLDPYGTEVFDFEYSLMGQQAHLAISFDYLVSNIDRGARILPDVGLTTVQKLAGIRDPSGIGRPDIAHVHKDGKLCETQLYEIKPDRPEYVDIARSQVGGYIRQWEHATSRAYKGADQIAIRGESWPKSPRSMYFPTPRGNVTLHFRSGGPGVVLYHFRVGVDRLAIPERRMNGISVSPVVIVAAPAVVVVAILATPEAIGAGAVAVGGTAVRWVVIEGGKVAGRAAAAFAVSAASAASSQ